MNLRFNIDISEAREMLAKAPSLMRSALSRAMSSGVLILEGQVKRNIGSPYDGLPPAVGVTGQLIGGVYGELLQGETIISGFVGVQPPADVYAPAVEYGARAHFPPVESLYRWVMKKFGLTEQSKIESAARAVARKIASKGTKGHFMFSRAYESERPAVEAQFDAEVDRAVETLQGGSQ